MSPAEDVDATWAARLRDLAERIRAAVGARLAAAVAEGDLAPLRERVTAGVGDWTYGIDVPSEAAVDAWLQETARAGPLSLFSEDAGWRHAGPDGALPDFDHGGPRIVVDPIDGTRNLMADLRSAWTVIGFAPPGAGMPRLSELTAGLLSELPTTRGGRFRLLEARGDACTLELRGLDGALLGAQPLRADDELRVDGGYFPFFRHAPVLRPEVARIEAAFFARLEAHEGAEPATCLDDQLISSGGQLALLALGTYRMICDPRPRVGARLGVPTRSALPFDVAGAVVVARAAGCLVEDLEGAPLDVPLDANSPVGFVGWANPATAERLRPHLQAALG